MTLRFFSAAGRLSRRDYALTIAALLGVYGVVTWLFDAVALPAAYLVSVSFFRDPTPVFWTLAIGASALLACFFCFLLPLFGIPAAIRRLHDMNRSGWFALPVAFSGIPLLCIGLGLGLMLIGILGFLYDAQGRALPLPIALPQDPLAFSVGSFLLGAGILSVSLLLLCAYTAWIFLKRGTPGENRYGAPSAEEQVPSVYAAYLSSTGAIDRGAFLLRSLVVTAVAGAVLTSVGRLVVTPLGMIFTSRGFLPYGVDDYISLLLAVLYPLAALPLVLRRLQTLGRSAYEALLVYAALLPYPLICIPMAKFLGLLQDTEYMHEGDISRLLDLVTVTPTSASVAVAAFWFVCGIASIVGIARLLREDAR